MDGERDCEGDGEDVPVTVPQEDPVRDTVGEGEALGQEEAEAEPLGAPLRLAPPLLEAHWVSLRDCEPEPVCEADGVTVPLRLAT